MPVSVDGHDSPFHSITGVGNQHSVLASTIPRGQANQAHASTSGNLERRTRRNRLSRRTRNSGTVVNVDEEFVEESSTSCIDLTVDTPGNDVIDLTRRSSVSLMDSPVVILTPADHIGPVRRRRGSGRRGRHRSNSGRSARTELFTTRGSHVHVLLSGDSDSDEMPDVPFVVPDFSVAANETVMRSPEGVKISCPVCLDDTKQIQRSGKVVMSTTCGHIFCDMCIQAAINAQHACPTCRKKLYLRNVHPLFL